MSQSLSPRQELKARHVFIDTSVYEGNNFNFDGQRFAALKLLVSEDRISLYTTTITINEVFARIAHAVSDAANAQRSIRNRLKILKNLEDRFFAHYFLDFDESRIRSYIENKFLNFIREFHVETIKITNVNIEKIFEDYFNKRPPFSEGKKKYEFPDAFVVDSFQYWCKEQKGREIYVVSSDSGMRDACERYNHLHAMETLDELTNLVSLHFNKVHLAIHSLINRYQNEIKCRIQDEFARFDFVLDEWDGEIIDVSVSNVIIKNVFILRISEDDGLADIRVRVDFSADLLLPPGLDGEIFDRSDWERRHIDRHYDTSFAVEFEYDAHKLKELQIKNATNTENLDTVYIRAEDTNS